MELSFRKDGDNMIAETGAVPQGATERTEEEPPLEEASSDEKPSGSKSGKATPRLETGAV